MSDRVFGNVWSFIFGLFALLPLWKGGVINVPPAVASVLLALIAALAPGLLALPNREWTRLGKTVNGVTSIVILFLIYFLFLTPGAMLLRMCGRDQLKRDLDPKASTYWAERSSCDTDFTRPY